jgi:hypothetical protein
MGESTAPSWHTAQTADGQIVHFGAREPELLLGGGMRLLHATATKSAVLRATEELGARSTDCTSWSIIPGGVSDPQAARGAKPRRPTDR